MSKYYDQKIIHRRNVAEYLKQNGGELLAVKDDIKCPQKKIYVFRYSTIKEALEKYKSPHKGKEGQDGKSKCD